MDLLRNQIHRISQQLAGLNATQKMLAFALVMIMGMSLIWWTQYTGQSEMSVLFDKTLTTEELSSMATALNSAGIKSKIVNNRIMVASEEVIKAWSALSYSQVLPRDTQGSFEEMLKSSSAFDSAAKTKEIFNELRQNRLAAMIRGYPDVAGAMVMIDATNERGPNRVEPTATASITMRRGASPPQQLVNAAADLITGAVANLARSKVKVIVDGVSYPVRDRNNASAPAIAEDNIAQIQKSEEYYHTKLASQFSWLNGAFFAVSVKTNNVSTSTKIHDVDPTKKVQIAENEKSTNEENKSSQTTSEAGLTSNAPLTAGGGNSGGEGTSSTVDKSETTSRVDYGMKDTLMNDPGGTCTVMSAAVHVPRSYFIRSFQVTNNVKEEPGNDKLEPYISTELKKLKPGVMACLDLKTDESVVVDVFTDLMPLSPMGGGSSAGIALSDALTGHVKEIALGVLALASLFMASNIVRKNAPAPALPPPPKAPKPGLDMMENGDMPVGEAVEGMGALEAVELDDEETRSHQMQQQVADLVNTNPDVAANLVKRWLNRT
jgi:flagellar biosynthesis/type III secretory pathway M-ring protein FliF/YscJ